MKKLLIRIWADPVGSHVIAFLICELLCILGNYFLHFFQKEILYDLIRLLIYILTWA